MISKTDKRLTIFLGLMTVLIFIFGYLQMKKTIYSPFQAPKQTSAIVTIPTQEEVSAILDQQDTDKDGLSDFDEKFVYQTAVYNQDSDSDGFTDKEEVDAQSDPLNSKSTPYHTPEPTKEDAFTSIDAIASRQEISIQEIRDLLVEQGGLSREIVDKLDDKTLEQLYNETKQETGIDLSGLEAPSAEERQFSDLTMAEIRQLLISQGIDETLLDSIDDETLRTMFLQSLGE